MLFQGACLAALVVFQLVNGVTLQNEKIDPVSLNYFCFRTQGAGKEHNKSDILLIHGIPGNNKNWEGVRQVLALETGRRVCVVDLRNHGDSPWNDRADVEAMAVDIGNFLDTQNIKKVNIIGHSLGGKISVHYALRNPEKVNSIAVEDMRPNGVPENLKKDMEGFNPFMRPAMDSVPEGSTVEEAEKLIIDYINKKLKELGENEAIDLQGLRNFGIRCDDKKCRYKMNINAIEKALKKFDEFLTTSSGLYSGPALFIYGKSSPFDVGSERENILNLFPNAKLVGVEGAGHQIHGLFREFNDEVIKMLNALNT